MDHEAVVLPYGRMNPIGKSSKFNGIIYFRLVNSKNCYILAVK